MARLVFRFAINLVLAWGVASNCAVHADTENPTPQELFDQRILPIFQSADPSSCVQCHLASVDLKSYILPSQQNTFVSLRDQGLIDLDEPDSSKILTLIQMGEQDLDEGARLIHDVTRKAEYEAFASWIRACCRDPQLRNLPPLANSQPAGPTKPDPVIRHARRNRVVDSFARLVWSQRLRCFPCHTPYEIDPANPRHEGAVKKQKELLAQYGPEMAERLGFFRETPAATLQHLIEHSRQSSDDRLPLINLHEPTKSLLVLKPTSKLPNKHPDGAFDDPSCVEPVSHMGGLKMHPNDQSHKSFIAWIQDYANVVGDRYVSVEELPDDIWRPSLCVIRLSNTPESWSVGTVVQLFVHPWSEADQCWQLEPVAFTQGTVTPRRFVNGSLFMLTANRPTENVHDDDPANASLPPGRYLIKAYVDAQNVLQDNPAALLSEDDFVGEVVLPEARWREGFRRAEVVSGKELTTDE